MLQAVTQQRNSWKPFQNYKGWKKKGPFWKRKKRLWKGTAGLGTKGLGRGGEFGKGTAYLRDLNEKLKGFTRGRPKAQELKTFFDLFTQFEKEQERLESEQRALKASQGGF